MLRLELLIVKADLERELGRLVLHCTACGLDVHWVGIASRRDIGRIGARAARRSHCLSHHAGLCIRCTSERR
jgi:hypothetical protein